MRQYQSLSAACAALAAGSLAAVPAVSGLVVQQSASSPLVTVAYGVSEECVVTLKVETKNAAGEWKKVEKGVAHYVQGDMYRLVAAGAHEAVWHPRAALGDRAYDAESCRVSVEAWAKDAPPDYMCVDVCFGGPVRYYPSADAVPLGVTNTLYLTDKMLFRRIPAKNVSWMMGCSPAQAAVHGSDAAAVSVYHEVDFTKDYYFGVYPVTRRQHFYVTGLNTIGSGLGGLSELNRWDTPFCPASGMSFRTLRGAALGAAWPVVEGGVLDETASHRVDPGSIIQAFRDKTGVQADLPTEAQWEYACRAGTAEDFCNGYNLAKDDTNYDKQGLMPPGAEDVCHAPSRYPAGDGVYNVKHIRAIGVNQKKPNAWGVYSCHGNCFELCLDRYAAGTDYSDGSPAVDPYGATAEKGQTDANGVPLRAMRGGGSFNSVFNAVSHKRSYGDETFARCDVSYRLAAPYEAR